MHVFSESPIINSGTQVYEAPYDGAISGASPYSGSARIINFSMNGGYQIGTASLPVDGIFEDIIIPPPPDYALNPASTYYDALGLPVSAIKEGADILTGDLHIYDSSGGLVFFTAAAVFQGGDHKSGEWYTYFYSKGDITVQQPKTQIYPGFYVTVNLQIKAGWNYVAQSESEKSYTMISKNPPPDARWVWVDDPGKL